MPESLTDAVLTSDTAIGDWTLDPDATTVRIAHKTMWGLVTVKGTFAAINGSGTVGPDLRIAGTVVVNASSIDTGNAKRDTHVRSADLLDVDAHPTIEVSVLSVTPGDDNLDLAAEPTVKGVREPVPLAARVVSLSDTRLDVTVSGTVDRRRFGLTWNHLGMMKDLTEVTVDAVFTRPTR